MKRKGETCLGKETVDHGRETVKLGKIMKRMSTRQRILDLSL